MNPIKHNFLPLSFFISLVGLLFSAWNVFDFSHEFCVLPSGCEVFVDFTLFGISLWWLGIAFCTVTLCLALFGKVSLGKLFSGIGVILDTGLIIVMIFSMPCSNCLVIGSCIALIHLAFYIDNRNKSLPFELPKPKLLLPWIVAFLMVLGNILMAQTNPWPVAGSYEDDVHVYFSFSCPACNELLMAQGEKDGVAWFPVQEGDEDAFAVKYLQGEMAKGVSFKQAYAQYQQEKPKADIFDVFNFEHWSIQFSLWKNAAHVMRAGKGSLPLVQYHGLPSHLNPQRTQEIKITYDSNNGLNIKTNEDGLNVVDDLLGNVVGACNDEVEEPCPEF